MAATRNPSTGTAGFTLLELVVALALTGLLTLVVFNSLNLTLKALGRGQAQAEAMQQLRVCQSMVARSLSSAVAGTQESNPSKSYFVGQPQEMRFLTPVPLEAHNLGGIYHFRVFSGRDESGQGCLAVEQNKAITWRQDPGGVEVRQILIRNLTSLRFSYGRGPEEFETWDAERRESLPDWVRVQLTPAGQEPVVWYITIHVAETQEVQGSR